MQAEWQQMKAAWKQMKAIPFSKLVLLTILEVAPYNLVMHMMQQQLALHLLRHHLPKTSLRE